MDAIFNEYDSDTYIRNCNFTNNISLYGAIENRNKLSIHNCLFENNLGTDTYEYGMGGGAIKNWDNGLLVINNSIFKNNTALRHGGAIYNRGSLILNNSILTDNKAKLNGGAIYSIASRSYEIYHSNLTYNWAENGGAIFVEGIDYSQYDDREYINYANNIINRSVFSYNVANNSGGAIYSEGPNNMIKSNIFSYNTAKNASAIYTKFETNYLHVIGYDTWYLESGIPIKYPITNGTYILPSKGNFTITNNTFIQNNAKSTGQAIVSNGTNNTIKNNKNDKTSVFSSTILINGLNHTITRNIFDDRLKTINITLFPIKGVIGENIILKAVLTDENKAPVTGGNIVFKLNGKTLRSDGRFDSKAVPMKFSVKNGTVTYTIKADLYLRNTKNLTVSYSSTKIYKQTTSPSVTAQIQKRYASLTVTINPTKARHYQTLTFKIKAKDTTKNGKNNTLIYDDTKVILKVNGVTLKDSKNKIIYLSLNKNAQATYKYIIPAGTSAITNNKTLRNYNVTAIFVGNNYLSWC